MMLRPFQPPPLLALVADEDGSAAARLRAEERIRASAMEAGRQRGLEEGLARGRAEGQAEGHAAAEQALRAELAQRGRQGAAAAAVALEKLLADHAEERRRLDAELRATVVAALEALFPVLLARAAGGEVAALLAAALAEREAEAITLRAHPGTLAAAQAEGFPGEPQDAGRLRLLPDNTMPPGQAEAAWAGGGLVYDPAALRAQVLAILGAPGPTQTDAAAAAQENPS
ncbi:hypothetical protein E0493_19775 [Roseomonas sp. M0104]|uniref:Flagellar assembly protein FliH/Type III secretion system HrpE domain-containing protein n=1 Tax=Teichococcus coralli TaxID=2545983 RepID=A0A845BEP5_9PROT|nr:hypothetical protein [Pseudoroseomonas coralli]MXP65591.1 hypothetical protein [Pseudoroseomonas coralli]